MPSPIPAGAIGAFGDLGGQVNTVLIWDPPPKEVEAALLSIAGYYERLSAPLRAASRITRQDIQLRFSTETDPTGAEWEDLDPLYLSWKATHGKDTRKLRMDNRMYPAAIAPGNFVIDSDSGYLFYNTSNLDAVAPYWRVHQEGMENSEASIIAAIRRGGAAAKAAMSAEFNPSSGARSVPQRAFIGISAEAEERIFNAFDIWFFEGISVKVSSAGVIQKASGGRFGATLDI